LALTRGVSAAMRRSRISCASSKCRRAATRLFSFQRRDVERVG
jgi:hypothetical protein